MIRIMLCENDPDNGSFSGKLWAIEIQDWLELRAYDMNGYNLTYPVKEKFRLHRKVFDFKSGQSWVGNWCWDSVYMSGVDTLRLLNHLKEQRAKDGMKLWQAEAGLSQWCDWWDSLEPLTKEKWDELIHGQTAERSIALVGPIRL
jgi:hypothetical protein